MAPAPDKYASKEDSVIDESLTISGSGRPPLRKRAEAASIGENPDIPVAELSERCGFYTVRSLQRAFLAITGMSPREYAKKVKQQNQAI